MPISLVPITGSVPMPSGEAFTDATLIFTLTGPDAEDDSGIPAAPVEVALSGTDIPAGFELWRNTAGDRATSYQVSVKALFSPVPGVQAYRTLPLGLIQVGPASSYTIGDLLAAYVVPGAWTPQAKMPDGTAGAPGLAFTADTDTGFYRPGANRVGLSLGGVAQGDLMGSNEILPIGIPHFPNVADFLADDIPTALDTAAVAGQLLKADADGPITAANLRKWSPPAGRFDITLAASASSLASDFGGVAEQWIADCAARGWTGVIGASDDPYEWDRLEADLTQDLWLDLTGANLFPKADFNDFICDGTVNSFTLGAWFSGSLSDCSSVYLTGARTFTGALTNPSTQFEVVSGNTIRRIAGPPAGEQTLRIGNRWQAFRLTSANRSRVWLRGGFMELSRRGYIPTRASGSAFGFQGMGGVYWDGAPRVINSGGDFTGTLADQRSDSAFVYNDCWNKYLAGPLVKGMGDLAVYDTGGADTVSGGDDGLGLNIMGGDFHLCTNGVKMVRQGGSLNINGTNFRQCVTGIINSDLGPSDAGRNFIIHAHYFDIARRALDLRNTDSLRGRVTIEDWGYNPDGSGFLTAGGIDDSAAISLSDCLGVSLDVEIHNRTRAKKSSRPAIQIVSGTAQGNRIVGTIRNASTGLRETGGTGSTEFGGRYELTTIDVDTPIVLASASNSLFTVSQLTGSPVSGEQVFSNNPAGMTRAHAVAAHALGLRIASGRVIQIEGLQYRGVTGSTAIADLPGLVPHGSASPRHFGAVGDGVTDDTTALTACDASGLGPFDLLGRTYVTTILSTAIVGQYYNGTLITVNSDGTQDIYRVRQPITDAELTTTGRKTPVLDWAGRTVLWLGTSIPQEGNVSSDSYPQLIATALGFTAINNAWAGSFMRWPGETAIDPDGSINQVKSLSMTAADVAAGLALHGPGSVFDEAYDVVTKANQMTADARIVNAFKSAPISVVVLDHAHNDRRNAPGTLTPPTFTITGVTIGTTTVFALSSATGIVVGDGVTVRITGISNLDYAFGRVTAVSGTNVTVAYDSAGLVGTFSSGTLTKVDRNTLYGATDFLVSAIQNSGLRYGSVMPPIILAGPPSEYTGGAFDVPIWSVTRRLETYAAARGISFFDIGKRMDVKAADHALYFPDSVHPTTLEARRVISRHWIEWMSGGAPRAIAERSVMLTSVAAIDQRPMIFSAALGGYIPMTRFQGPESAVLSDDFADGDYTGWTPTGASPTVIDAPWGAGKAIQCDTTAGQTNAYISRSVSTNTGVVCEFDLWMPVVSGLTSGTVKQIPILQLRSTGAYISAQIVVTEGACRLRLAYFKAANTDLVNGANLLTMEAARKYRIKVASFRTTVNGQGFLALYADGVLLGTVQTEDLAQTNIATVRLGTVASTLAANVSVILGNFVLTAFPERVPLNGNVTIGGNTVSFHHGIPWSVT